MRHFYSVNADGDILGTCVRPEGFQDDHDLSDPGCEHPLVIDHRRLSANIPEFDRFVEYVCQCPSSIEHCTCATTNLTEFYAEGSVLTPKPALTVVIDGAALGSPVSGDPLVRGPGATVTFQLQADVPDGHQVTVRTGGPASVLPAEAVLTFTAGQTPEIDLTAPGHNMVGGVAGRSKYVRRFCVQLRGVS